MRPRARSFDLGRGGCYGRVKLKFRSDMAKLHLITYGCQMNEYDSERVAGLLREHRPCSCSGSVEWNVVHHGSTFAGE